jgi:hypothetical protein
MMNAYDLENLTKAAQGMDMVCSDIHELCRVRDEPFLSELATMHLQTAVKLKQDLDRLLTLSHEHVERTGAKIDKDDPLRQGEAHDWKPVPKMN